MLNQICSQLSIGGCPVCSHTAHGACAFAYCRTKQLTCLLNFFWEFEDNATCILLMELHLFSFLWSGSCCDMAVLRLCCFLIISKVIRQPLVSLQLCLMLPSLPAIPDLGLQSVIIVQTCFISGSHKEVACAIRLPTDPSCDQLISDLHRPCSQPDR